MNYPAAKLRSIKMDYGPINPDAEHRGILLIKRAIITHHLALIRILNLEI